MKKAKKIKIKKMIDKKEKATLKKHKKHHTAKHMASMKKDMRKGMTFKKSHNKAMRKVGA
jgi:hypothetical protein